MPEAIPPLAVVAIASAIVLHHLDFSAWFDEAYSFGMSAQPLHDFLSVWAWGPESNMFLYYLLLRGWLGTLALLGQAPNEVLLRVPSASFAIGASLVVYALGRFLIGRIAGVVAAGLFAANFLHMILAQTARAYSLGLLLLSLSWLALFIALKKERTRWWILYVAASVLSVYALLITGLVLVSQVIAVAVLAVLPGPWHALVRNGLRQFVTSIVVAGLAILPIGLDAVLHGGPKWVPPAQVKDLRLFLYVLTGQSRAYEYLVLATAGVGTVLAAAAASPRFRTLVKIKPDTFGAALALVVWFGAPVVITYALTQPGVNLHLFYPRYLVIVVPPLCLLAGLGVQSIRPLFFQAALVIALALVAWPPLGVYYQNAEVQNFKDPVAWMQNQYQAGDGIVCDPEVECSIPVAYYLEANPGRAHLGADSPGWFSWQNDSSVPVTSETVREYAAHHRRIFFVYGPLGPNASMDASAASMEAQLTANGYRLVDQFTAKGSVVSTSILLYQM